MACFGFVCEGKAVSTGSEISYRVRFEGVPDRELLQDLRQVSDMLALRDRPPRSMRQLERRANRDIEQFLQVLQTHGYYEAAVEVRIRDRRSPIRVTFEVMPGPRYAIEDIQIVIRDLPNEGDKKMTGLASGDPARALPIVAAEERIVRALEDRGYPFARVIERNVWIKRSARVLNVLYVVEAGPRADFGETRIHGLSSVNERFVRRKLPWQPGDRFDGAKIRLAQRRIFSSDLFSTVRVIRGELQDDGALPIDLELLERKHRSVSLGTGYRSDEGARASAGWEHRNIAGKGERLSINTVLSEIGYSGEGRFQKPDFKRLDQMLSVSLRAGLDDPDAYRSRNYGVLIGIERLLHPGLLLGVGAGFRYTSVLQFDEEESFGLLYFPLHVDWDRSDDLLDPHRGYRLAAGVAPYRDVINTDVSFLKGRTSLTSYQPIGPRPELIWANRATVGWIAGAGLFSVPADERFYAGGGGSVRGYSYQSVGPLDGKKPLGGRSIAVLSSELRWRISNDFGLVVFMDGGTAYESQFPDRTDTLLWGAGTGVRYFTPVGPLRFDLAFPLDRRRGIDDAYQFYISLGQAF